MDEGRKGGVHFGQGIDQNSKTMMKEYAMNEGSQSVVSLRAESTNPMEVILREGARQMLQHAIEAEVIAYVSSHSDQVDDRGRKQVVRNGWHPPRHLQTGLGNLEIQRPKVHDRRVDDQGRRPRFSSKILPAYLRRTKSMEELLPWLYLRGISTGDFDQALSTLLGEDAGGLSASTVTRLKKVWGNEHASWSRRDLTHKRYVYIWADGIYTKIRLGEDKRSCMLVIIGATEDGTKELLAIEAGQRESKLSWSHVLLDLKSRGLEVAPELAVADGALGFWSALSEVFPETREQRCWVHKIANVLDKLPKSRQPEAKAALHEIYRASTKKEAESAFDLFLGTFGDRYPEATKCLSKDREDLLNFYDFPAAHWKHIRTTNPIESTFATIRLRTKRTKGSGSVSAALGMVFKLAVCAEKTWRKLDRPNLLRDVISDEYVFVDGERQRVA